VGTLAYRVSCAPPVPDAMPAAAIEPEPTVRGALPWGVYMTGWGHDRGRDPEADLRALGGKPQYTLFFHDLSQRRGFPTRRMDYCRETGTVPIVSLELIEWRRGEADRDGLSGLVAGDYDQWCADWARAAAAYEGEILLRFGYEMNGDWFPWGQRPEAFKAAWRRAHAIFQEAGATNVKWVFSANILYGDMTPATGFAAYYPGADVVDMVGLDGYNFGDGHDEWHSWESYDAVFSRSIAGMEQFAKPLLLTEVGCADDPRKSAWVADFLARVARDPRVTGFIWFHHDKRAEGEPNWRLDSDPDSLAVFRAWTQTQLDGSPTPR